MSNFLSNVNTAMIMVISLDTAKKRKGYNRKDPRESNGKWYKQILGRNPNPNQKALKNP